MRNLKKVLLMIVLLLLVSCKEDRDLLKEANAVKVDDPKEAIELYQEILEEDILSFDAYVGLSSVYYKEADYKALEDVLSKVYRYWDAFEDVDNAQIFLDEYITVMENKDYIFGPWRDAYGVAFNKIRSVDIDGANEAALNDDAAQDDDVNQGDNTSDNTSEDGEPSEDDAVDHDSAKDGASEDVSENNNSGEITTEDTLHFSPIEALSNYLTEEDYTFMVSHGSDMAMVYDSPRSTLLEADQGFIYEMNFYPDIENVDETVENFIKALWDYEVYGSTDMPWGSDTDDYNRQILVIDDLINTFIGYRNIVDIEMRSTYMIGYINHTFVDVHTSNPDFPKLSFMVMSTKMGLGVLIEEVNFLVCRDLDSRKAFEKATKKEQTEITFIDINLLENHNNRSVDKTDPRDLNSAGVELYNQGYFDLAASLFKQGTRLEHSSDDTENIAMCHYNLACMVSLLSSSHENYDFIDETIFYLERAFELRDDRIARALEDEDLDNIRNTEEFIQLIEKYSN